MTSLCGSVAAALTLMFGGQALAQAQSLTLQERAFTSPIGYSLGR